MTKKSTKLDKIKEMDKLDKGTKIKNISIEAWCDARSRSKEKISRHCSSTKEAVKTHYFKSRYFVH